MTKSELRARIDELNDEGCVSIHPKLAALLVDLAADDPAPAPGPEPHDPA